MARPTILCRKGLLSRVAVFLFLAPVERLNLNFCGLSVWDVEGPIGGRDGISYHAQPHQTRIA